MVNDDYRRQALYSSKCNFLFVIFYQCHNDTQDLRCVGLQLFLRNLQISLDGGQKRKIYTSSSTNTIPLCGVICNGKNKRQKEVRNELIWSPQLFKDKWGSSSLTERSNADLHDLYHKIDWNPGRHTWTRPFTQNRRTVGASSPIFALRAPTRWLNKRSPSLHTFEDQLSQ